MAKKPAAAKAPSSYELMAARVSRIINSQSAQKSKSAILFCGEDESQDDWARLLGEIGETDNVTLAYRDDGGVQLFWVVPKED